MWDLIVSVPDHCLSFYFVNVMKRFVYLFSGIHPTGCTWD